eukprot:3100633-Pleurochrysis_carterae.AAC.2
MLVLASSCSALGVPFSHRVAASFNKLAPMTMYASPFALSQNFPLSVFDDKSAAITLEINPATAAAAADFTSTIQEFACAASDLGVTLTNVRGHGSLKFVAWGSKRALKNFERRCADANGTELHWDEVTLTWQRS